MQCVQDIANEEPRFSRDTRPSLVAEGCFRTTLHERWSMDRGPNGGYLAALLLNALKRSVRDSKQVDRSYHVRFMSAAKPGAAEIATRIERSGRSLTFAAGELRQGEQLCVTGSLTTSSDRPSLAYAPIETPEGLRVAPDKARVLDVPGMPVITKQFEYRSLFATPVTPCSDARIGGFIRLRESQPIDSAVLTACVDAWFPASLTRSPCAIYGTTIDLTIHFRNQAKLAALPYSSYLYTQFSSRSAGEGFVDEDGEIWSEDGVLLAQSRQLRVATPLG